MPNGQQHTRAVYCFSNIRCLVSTVCPQHTRAVYIVSHICCASCITSVTNTLVPYTSVLICMVPLVPGASQTHSCHIKCIRLKQFQSIPISCNWLRLIHLTHLISRPYLIGSTYQWPCIDRPCIDMPRLCYTSRGHISICHVFHCNVTHITIRDGTITPRIPLQSLITPRTQDLLSQIHALSRDIPDHTRWFSKRHITVIPLTGPRFPPVAPPKSSRYTSLSSRCTS
jgi:hypothetical protein